jgi:outer membrane protein assembly factor BamD
VVTEYQTTSHVPEALHRLTETYLALGVASEAQTSAAVLGYNFPGSEWYQDSYGLLTEAHLKPEENKKSWISRAWHAVL